MNPPQTVASPIRQLGRTALRVINITYVTDGAHHVNGIVVHMSYLGLAHSARLRPQRSTLDICSHNMKADDARLVTSPTVSRPRMKIKSDKAFVHQALHLNNATGGVKTYDGGILWLSYRRPNAVYLIAVMVYGKVARRRYCEVFTAASHAGGLHSRNVIEQHDA